MFWCDEHKNYSESFISASARVTLKRVPQHMYNIASQLNDIAADESNKPWTNLIDFHFARPQQ